MIHTSISKPLIENCKNFLDFRKTTTLKSLEYFFKQVIFVGWGRKKSGHWAVKMAKLTNNKFLLLEDGFIRSFGLGVEGSPSFSLVKDDIGIYYDATSPSKLENILNTYNFKDDSALMDCAKEAIEKIIRYKISKYNNSNKVNLDFLDTKKDKVLIIAQTFGDSSLEYGLGYNISTLKMINDAIEDNPSSEIYIKVHPDVIGGIKKSDIDIEQVSKKCKIITKNINSILLLSYFNKIYTKTSGMGMEALLLKKEVYCYGLPFYAGWGLTLDKQSISRRNRKLEVEELFAGAYILYTEYYNPYLNKKVDILEVIEYLNENKKL